ncbi:MAG: winged helix-turn-helix transcriptional regulator [Planctomycetota bacterium]|nr:winged helix-turn-helix transcriptional regulator [Planctomycetota bacterium]
MARRSYHQYCALARTLDLVGERWTLLLVRELLSGPARFKDLQVGLAGMGTNLLSDRLKELVEAGLIEREDRLYQLTPRGRELEESVVALARFGAPLLGERSAQELWRAEWNVVALQYAFCPERAKNAEGVIEYRIDESCVQAKLTSGALETAGEARWEPDVVIRADGETFLQLAAGELDPKNAEEQGRLELIGSRRLWRTSLRVFSVAR